MTSLGERRLGTALLIAPLSVVNDTSLAFAHSASLVFIPNGPRSP